MAMIEAALPQAEKGLGQGHQLPVCPSSCCAAVTTLPLACLLPSLPPSLTCTHALIVAHGWLVQVVAAVKTVVRRARKLYMLNQRHEAFHRHLKGAPPIRSTRANSGDTAVIITPH